MCLLIRTALVTQYEWLKDVLMSKQAHLFSFSLTSTCILVHIKAGRKLLCFLLHTHTHLKSQIDSLSGGLALLLQPFCFAPVRGRNLKHLRFMPVWARRLHSVTNLVPQVCHPYCSASLNLFCSQCIGDPSWWRLRWITTGHTSRNALLSLYLN